MAVEIERKFLTSGDSWRHSVARVRRLRQAYLTQSGRFSLRVRVDDEGATLTIKTAEPGVERLEYEYSIPTEDALELIERREGALISKSRYIVSIADMTWEIDVFDGENDGLIIAEVELPGIDAIFMRPDWLGEEITCDHRYYNSELAKNPYQRWRGSPKSIT